MKKLLILLVSAAALLFMYPAGAFAQGRFGVIGGMTLSNAERQSLNRSTMNRFHAGVTFQMKLPFGFSIQPALMYHVKGAKLGGVIQNTELNNTCDLTIGYLELPVSVQWGPDLLLFRPFLDVTPYIGCGLNNRMDAYIEHYLPRDPVGRYNWNFGSLYAKDDASESDYSLVGMMREAFSSGHNLGGFTLTLSLLF